MNKRQIFWLGENLFFATLVYFAIAENNVWAEWGVVFFILFLSASITIMLTASFGAEYLWSRGQLEYFWGPIDKYRIKGPSVPVTLVLIIETVWAALFAAVGWYWLAAAQVYLIAFLLYVFDSDMIAETKKRVEERCAEVERKLDDEA